MRSKGHQDQMAYILHRLAEEGSKPRLTDRRRAAMIRWARECAWSWDAHDEIEGAIALYLPEER